MLFFVYCWRYCYCSSCFHCFVVVVDVVIIVVQICIYLFVQIYFLSTQGLSTDLGRSPSKHRSPVWFQVWTPDGRPRNV